MSKRAVLGALLVATTWAAEKKPGQLPKDDGRLQLNMSDLDNSVNALDSLRLSFDTSRSHGDEIASARRVLRGDELSQRRRNNVALLKPLSNVDGQDDGRVDRELDSPGGGSVQSLPVMESVSPIVPTSPGLFGKRPVSTDIDVLSPLKGGETDNQMAFGGSRTLSRLQSTLQYARSCSDMSRLQSGPLPQLSVEGKGRLFQRRVPGNRGRAESESGVQNAMQRSLSAASMEGMGPYWLEVCDVLLLPAGDPRREVVARIAFEAPAAITILNTEALLELVLSHAVQFPWAWVREANPVLSVLDAPVRAVASWANAHLTREADRMAMYRAMDSMDYMTGGADAAMEDANAFRRLAAAPLPFGVGGVRGDDESKRHATAVAAVLATAQSGSATTAAGAAKLWLVGALDGRVGGATLSNVIGRFLQTRSGSDSTLSKHSAHTVPVEALRYLSSASGLEVEGALRAARVRQAVVAYAIVSEGREGGPPGAAKAALCRLFVSCGFSGTQSVALSRVLLSVPTVDEWLSAHVALSMVAAMHVWPEDAAPGSYDARFRTNWAGLWLHYAAVRLQSYGVRSDLGTWIAASGGVASVSFFVREYAAGRLDAPPNSGYGSALHDTWLEWHALRGAAHSPVSVPQSAIGRAGGLSVPLLSALWDVLRATRLDAALEFNTYCHVRSHLATYAAALSILRNGANDSTLAVTERDLADAVLVSRIVRSGGSEILAVIAAGDMRILSFGSPTSENGVVLRASVVSMFFPPPHARVFLAVRAVLRGAHVPRALAVQLRMLWLVASARGSDVPMAERLQLTGLFSRGEAGAAATTLETYAIDANDEEALFAALLLLLPNRADATAIAPAPALWRVNVLESFLSGVGIPKHVIREARDACAMFADAAGTLSFGAVHALLMAVAARFPVSTTQGLHDADASDRQCVADMLFRLPALARLAALQPAEAQPWLLRRGFAPGFARAVARQLVRRAGANAVPEAMQAAFREHISRSA